ncbi:MAG: dihydrolipoamide acetyltransferase family protein [Solirubrobacterales bacterium]
MPRLSDSMEEGTIVKWLKEVGDEVAKGEEIVEIETDKANMTYESDADGTLIEIIAEEGDTLPIGDPIAKIGDESEASESSSSDDEDDEDEDQEDDGSSEKSGTQGEDDDQAEEDAQDDDEEEDAEASAEASASDDEGGESGSEQASTSSSSSDSGDGTAPPAPEVDGERVKASPVARRVAQDLGVDIADLDGSGPGGRIIKADVEQAADGESGGGDAGGEEPEKQSGDSGQQQADGGQQRETARGTVETVDPSRTQQTIARRMAESKANVPHFYLSAEIDMSEAVSFRDKVKDRIAEDEKPPSYNDMVVKACAKALKEHPKANGAYKDGKFELYSRINVGVAVAAEGTLVVPTIFDADKKGLGEISADTRELAQKVRDGKVAPPDVSGGTFTVSNLGMFGIENFAAVVNMPQAAILAVGRLARKPVVDDRGEVVARHMVGVTLACDHRILYGADGADFLATIRRYLEDPLLLAL